MEPEDRVLVGVINRKRDLVAARDEHWYRIPRARLSRGVYFEYLAFFLSGAFGADNGSVRYYAERNGFELAYRRDLLPKEATHRRANEIYYRIGIGPLLEKLPPVRNSTKRSVSFIYTTWDRFVGAREVSDFYSKDDYYVDRIFHALHDSGARVERFWEAERKATGHGAHLNLLCEGGSFVAGPELEGDSLLMDDSQPDDVILASIRAEIARRGGPVTINIPLDGE